MSRWNEEPEVARKRKAKRNRHPKCATQDVRWWLFGEKLVPWWHPSSRPSPCWRHVEKGQMYCVECQRVARALASRAEQGPDNG